MGNLNHIPILSVSTVRSLRRDFPGFCLGQAERLAVRLPHKSAIRGGNRAEALTHFHMIYEEVNFTENRKRNETLTIRLTTKEKDMIRRKAEKARLSLTDYLVAAALQTQIHVAEDVKPIILELKRIGNNTRKNKA